MFIPSSIHPPPPPQQDAPLPPELVPRKRNSLYRASIASFRNHFSSSSSSSSIRGHEEKNKVSLVSISTAEVPPSKPDKQACCDIVEDREVFVNEYNRLARRHGIRPLQPQSASEQTIVEPPAEISRRWNPRSLLAQARRIGSWEKTPGCNDKHAFENLASQFKVTRKDTLKGHDLEELVRLCGRSMLHLPDDYAAGSLGLPTCLRAPAHHLMVNAHVEGLFRITGSIKNVNMLYNYYAFEDRLHVTETTRQPILPNHLCYEVHDVATFFKRVLAGIPGGILGSLSIFDALVAIQSQLRGGVQPGDKAHCKIRARLIALAIGSIQSQFRRELVCAVFGLLAMLAKIASASQVTQCHKMHATQQRSATSGSTEMMGYSALGIVFGPLLVGDLLNNHTVRMNSPPAGLVLQRTTPPRSRKELPRKRRRDGDSGSSSTTSRPLTVDKIHVANSIAEMLISNWREIVKHMKSLRILLSDDERSRVWLPPAPSPTKFLLRSSVSVDHGLQHRARPAWDPAYSTTTTTNNTVTATPPRYQQQNRHKPREPHVRTSTPYSRCSCLTPGSSRQSSAAATPLQKSGSRSLRPMPSAKVKESGESRHYQLPPSPTRTVVKQSVLENPKRFSSGSVQQRATHPALRWEEGVELNTNARATKVPAAQCDQSEKRGQEHGQCPFVERRLGSKHELSLECERAFGLKVSSPPRFSWESEATARNLPVFNRYKDKGKDIIHEKENTIDITAITACKQQPEPSSRESSPRRVTGLNNRAGSVKKLAAMFETTTRTSRMSLPYSCSGGSTTGVIENDGTASPLRKTQSHMVLNTGNKNGKVNFSSVKNHNPTNFYHPTSQPVTGGVKCEKLHYRDYHMCRGLRRPHSMLPLGSAEASAPTVDLYSERPFSALLPAPQSLDHPTNMTATTLHAVVRRLRRELSAQTGEVLRLRRELEVATKSAEAVHSLCHDGESGICGGVGVGNGGVGLLARRLREAESMVVEWRERATTAKRQVRMFQRFEASRARQTRGSMQSAGTRDSDHDDQDGDERVDLCSLSSSPLLVGSSSPLHRGRTSGVMALRAEHCFPGEYRILPEEHEEADSTEEEEHSRALVEEAYASAMASTCDHSKGYDMMSGNVKSKQEGDDIVDQAYLYLRDEEDFSREGQSLRDVVDGEVDEKVDDGLRVGAAASNFGGSSGSVVVCSVEVGAGEEL